MSAVLSAELGVAAPPVNCYHCGLAAEPGNGLDVAIDGALRPMCCPGCAAVAGAIVDNGLSDYYRARSSFAAPAGEQALVPAELALCDQGAANDSAGAELLFSVDGIRCAACVWLIEHAVARLAGVQDVSMNVTSGRLRVTGACKPSEVLRALAAIGYSAYPFDPDRRDAGMERERKSLFRQLFIAGLSMMQVMMYALPAYIAEDGTMDADMAALMRWASLLLTAPAVLYSARPFYRGAWRGIAARMPGMDVP
ncbi:MAG: heavy metal translocating P-type ATPase metal-binding domain-containing protein, partial [Gammaproteobacteria bacterium]